jgi:putative spermidine/putrescine transport system ATP-binding protein
MSRAIAAPAGDDRSSAGGAADGGSQLEIQAVRKSYAGVTALQGINLAVQQGELFCLLGPSGSGKSTLLNLIGGILEPDQGSIRLSGRDITRLAMQKRNVGIVFQNYALFPHLSVAANVAFGLRVRGMKSREISERVAELLALVHLGGKEERLPKQLSGGEQQRVAIARALAIRPLVLLLDEPLSNLDAKLRVEMQQELKRVQRETGVTTILVTHNQDEAFALGDRIGLMDSGSLIQVGTAEDLYSRPATTFVMRFIGEANMFAGDVACVDGRPVLSCGGHTLPMPEGVSAAGQATMMIRPEWMRLAEGSPSAEGIVRGTVTEVSYRGTGWRYSVDSPIGTLLALIPADSANRPMPGAEVAVSWDRERSVVLPEIDETKN